MFAMFPFKIKILISLKFQQQKKPGNEKEWIAFRAKTLERELRPSKLCFFLDL